MKRRLDGLAGVLAVALIPSACALQSSAIAPGSGDAAPVRDSAAVDGSDAASDARRDGATRDASRRDSTAADSSRPDSGAGDARMDSSMDTAPPDTGPPPCPSGYTRVLPDRTSCYRVSGSSRTWQEAERDCETDGAHLVVVDDAMEDDLVPDYHWIGYSETITDGDWLWVTGAGASSYEGWASGEPRFGGAACAVQRPDGWHDDNDYEDKRYVCEYDGVAADGSTWE